MMAQNYNSNTYISSIQKDLKARPELRKSLERQKERGRKSDEFRLELERELKKLEDK